MGKYGKRAVHRVGDPCRKCFTPVIRFDRPEEQQEKYRTTKYPGQFWHAWWLECPGCGIKYFQLEGKRLYENPSGSKSRTPATSEPSKPTKPPVRLIKLSGSVRAASPTRDVSNLHNVHTSASDDQNALVAHSPSNPPFNIQPSLPSLPSPSLFPDDTPDTWLSRRLDRIEQEARKAAYALIFAIPDRED